MESIDVGITPMSGYVLIEPSLQTDNSGIELPPHLQKNKNIGIVVAVCDNLPLPLYVQPGTSTGYNQGAPSDSVIILPQIKVKVNDIVYLRDYIDKPIEIGDKKYFFVAYEDILGIQK